MYDLILSFLLEVFCGISLIFSEKQSRGGQQGPGQAQSDSSALHFSKICVVASCGCVV
jgi:hypothetical protein